MEKVKMEYVQITIQDLQVIRGVIDAATRGGVLGAGDLTVVGKVHDKVHKIVEDFIEKNKPAEEEVKSDEQNEESK